MRKPSFAKNLTKKQTAAIMDLAWLASKQRGGMLNVKTGKHYASAMDVVNEKLEAIGLSYRLVEGAKEKTGRKRAEASK